MGYDVILMQETFLLQARIAGATRQASGLGFFISFVPARGTAGRPSGGLAILCRQGCSSAKDAPTGRLGAGLTTSCPLKVVCTSKNRELLLEVMGSVASLGKRPILLGGDWNFEPDDFPIDLVHGATVQRPLSDEAATSPVLHGEDTVDNGTKIDWFLVSKSLLPATGLEEALDFKPDRNVVQIPVALDLEAKARHSGAWTYALVARDVETLWPLWCRAAEHALGLPVGSRGSLLLARSSLAGLAPEEEEEEEAVEAAKQQATVTNLKRRLADTGGMTFFDWPLWLGPHPPTAAAQAKALQDWLMARNANHAKERKKSWQTYVAEMWKQAPKRIYKWIRGTVVVWDLAIRGSNGFALTLDETAKVELEAWSKLWRPGLVQLRSVVTDDPSAWSPSTISKIIKRCPAGKARGADRLGNERLTGVWLEQLREMLYLQLPKDGARAP
eukprot:6347297-Amphidinium_carterae.2